MKITPVAEMVKAAKDRITSHSVDEVAAMLDTPGVLIVDIRDVRELDRDGRIPGATHAPRGMLEFWVDPASPYHKPKFVEADKVVLFCASSWRSALSADTLRGMGLSTVSEMEGGFKAWAAAGKPVERKEDD